LADIDAQFAGELEVFVPDFAAVFAFGMPGDGILLEGQGVVPVVGVAIVHGTKNGGAVLRFVGEGAGGRNPIEHP